MFWVGLCVSVILGAMPDRFNHTGQILSGLLDKAEQFVFLHAIHDDKYGGQRIPTGVSMVSCVCKYLCLHVCKKTFAALLYIDYGIVSSSVEMK